MKSLQWLSALKTTFLTFNKNESNFVTYKGTSTELIEGETVLDALLRSGHIIPHGCRAGACQSCLMVSTQPVPSSAQNGLSSAQKSLNQFLACQYRPEGKIEVSGVNVAESRAPFKILSKDWLNQDVIRLRLIPDSDTAFEYRPGQYVTLWKDETLARSYSLASHPAQDNFLEFHIRVLDAGQFSKWISEQADVGQTIQVQGPLGTCFYTGNTEKPLLMSAIGTGLAPIYGILRDAVAQHHQATIDLVVGASSVSGFYLLDELRLLSEQQSNLRLHFLTQEGEADFAQTGDIYQYCKTHFPDLNGTGVFLCGAGSFVQKMRKQSFLSGAAMKDIASDTFLPFGI